MPGKTRVWTLVMSTVTLAFVELMSFAASAAPAHGEAGNHGAEHGGEHVGHATHEGIKWWGGATPEDPRIGVIILVINFLVLLFILNRILFKPLRDQNREKSDAIKQELERATEARSDAEQVLKVYKTKVEALESEVEDILAQAQRSADADRRRILEEAKEAALKIEANATATAERETALLRTRLEAEVVDQAMERAEALIRKNFEEADQRRLVDDYVKQIDGVSL